MAGETIGSLILWLIVLAIFVVIAVYLLRWLYRRSTKETAFVRTGFGGEKVVVSGGAFVIPVLHDVTLVNMTVMRIEVIRREAQALITKNRMRVDVIAEFFVKVGSSRQAVGVAAQTLGRRTLEPDGTRDLLEGRFASALRTVAAQMTLEQMHEQRQEYAQRVKTVALEGLTQNGLDLESVAIVDLDQTNLEFFDSSTPSTRKGSPSLPRRSKPADACATKLSSALKSKSGPRISTPNASRSISTEKANMRGLRRSTTSKCAAPPSASNSPGIVPFATRKASRLCWLRAKRSKSRNSFKNATWRKRESRTRKRSNSARSHDADTSTKSK